MILYHKKDCSRSEGFALSVCSDRGGWYVGYVCTECQTYNRETEYLVDEAAAWAEYEAHKRGVPFAHPREETEDQMMQRRLRQAGIDPVAEGEDLPETKRARILIGGDGSVSVTLEDPNGAKMEVRLHIKEWGIIAYSSTGYNSINSDDGFTIMFPASEHHEENMAHLAADIVELLEIEEGITPAAQNIDEESMA